MMLLNSRNNVLKLSHWTEIAAIVLFVLWMFPVAGYAQEAESGAGSGSSNRFVFDELQVFGEIDKPEAFYILRASSLDYEAIEPVESFLDEMYKSTQEYPF